MSERDNSAGRRWLPVALIGAAALLGSMMPAIAGGAWTRIDSAELERVRGSNNLSNPMQSSCDSKNLNNACVAAGGDCVACSVAGYNDTGGQAGNQASGKGAAQSCGGNVSGSCAAKGNTFFCDTSMGNAVGQCQPPVNAPGAQGGGAVPGPILPGGPGD